MSEEVQDKKSNRSHIPSPILNSVQGNKHILLGHLRYRGKEYGQVALTGPGGLGGVQSEVIDYKDAVELFNKIVSLIETEIGDKG